MGANFHDKIVTGTFAAWGKYKPTTNKFCENGNKLADQSCSIHQNTKTLTCKESAEFLNSNFKAI